MQKKLVALVAVLLAIFGALVALVEVLSDMQSETENSDTQEQVLQTPNPDYTYIHAIQGTGHISPLDGQQVKNVYGVITVSGPTFYIMQTPDEFVDQDIRTSEAIKVRTSKNHGVTVGALLLIDGTVSEFRPHISAYGKDKVDENALTLTQIVDPENVRVLKIFEDSDMPKPVIIGKAGRMCSSDVISRFVGSVETKDYKLNLSWGLDFYESLESMLVQIYDALVVSPNSYSSVFITPDGGKHATGMNSRGSIAISPEDYNPEIIKLKSGYEQKRIPKYCGTGDSLGTVIGTIDYDWGNYTIYTTKIFEYENKDLAQEFSKKTFSDDDLTVAAFNVENLDAHVSYERFNDLGQIIAKNLHSPDILVLEEIQDNNGANMKKVGKSGCAADETFSKLITAIKQANGPAYKFAQIDPVFGQEGGEPGGNIRIGFLYNPERVSMIERGNNVNKSVTATEIEDSNGKPALSLNPGRIDPKNFIYKGSRPPLAGEFMFKGHKVFVIGVHFRSKGGDASIWGWNQGQTPASEEKRAEQAKLVRDFASEILAIDKDALVIVAGDFNDYHFRKPVAQFADAGFKNLAMMLDPSDRYSMIYAGNAQLLDHILVPTAYFDKTEYDIVHVDSEFHDPASDHDPVFARFIKPFSK